MTRPAPVLRSDGLVAGYGDANIVRGCTLELGKGELVVIIGPNGAGKSTYLKALFGLLEARDGTVTLEGTDVTGTTPRQRVLAGMAYVPQVDNVFARLTIAENLEMGAYTCASEHDERRERVEEIFPALREKRREKAGSLSGGQRQMLAFGRALMTEPSVLLLDEPSAGLAPNLVDSVLGHVRTITEAGTSVLLVEQNAKQALAIADWAYVLDGGRAAIDGSGPDVLADPEVGRLYLGVRDEPARAEREEE